MEIKLSKEAEKAIGILKEISELCEDFKKIYIGLKEKEGEKELHLIGGLIGGFYSPTIELNLIIGCVPNIQGKGLMKQLSEQFNK